MVSVTRRRRLPKGPDVKREKRTVHARNAMLSTKSRMGFKEKWYCVLADDRSYEDENNLNIELVLKVNDCLFL